MKKILITGVAGFIGARLATLLNDAYEIIGIDNLNDYYDVTLKNECLKLLKEKKFRFIKMELGDKNSILSLFELEKFDVVIHLGA